MPKHPPGSMVRCKRTARVGRIDKVLEQPRNGRTVIVEWGSRNDYSMMMETELELAYDCPDPMSVLDGGWVIDPDSTGPKALPPFRIGSFIRDKVAGRVGRTVGIVHPPRNGRTLWVEWEGGSDYTLMAEHEIEGVPESEDLDVVPRGERLRMIERAGDWRIE